ncbi:hypothetical protein [Nostoc sp. KVJ20]|uniref:hypothetical protein n=1 Tax=Nostoc sp. KVJ20 TaxID=457944 RepID=UPI00159F3006|nr:hypothetical protein [Nostoc sp. KVJ20]
MEKLKIARQLDENLEDDFLIECWADNSASADCDKKVGDLIFAVELVVVDGLLVKWEE